MNPNLGSNSGMRIFEPRILGSNSGVEFFGPMFSNKKSPLKNSPPRNSPPKIHIRKIHPRIRAEKFTLHFCRAILLIKIKLALFAPRPLPFQKRIQIPPPETKKFMGMKVCLQKKSENPSQAPIKLAQPSPALESRADKLRTLPSDTKLLLTKNYFEIIIFQKLRISRVIPRKSHFFPEF